MNAAILKKLRKDKRINQKELAEILGVSPSTIGMYEQGRREPDHKTLVLLAKYFGISIDYLMGNECAAASIDRKELADELLRNLVSQNALMFRAGELAESDYNQLSDAIKIAVDMTMEKRAKKGELC